MKRKNVYDGNRGTGMDNRKVHKVHKVQLMLSSAVSFLYRLLE